MKSWNPCFLQSTKGCTACFTGEYSDRLRSAKNVVWKAPVDALSPGWGAPAGSSWERIPQASRGVWRPKNMNARQMQFVDKRDGLTWTVTICIYLLVANGRFTTLARSHSGSAVIVQNNWMPNKWDGLGCWFPVTKKHDPGTVLKLRSSWLNQKHVICVLCVHPCFLGHTPHVLTLCRPTLCLFVQSLLFKAKNRDNPFGFRIAMHPCLSMFLLVIAHHVSAPAMDLRHTNSSQTALEAGCLAAPQTNLSRISS